MSHFHPIEIHPTAPLSKVENIVKKLTIDFPRTLYSCRKHKTPALTNPSVGVYNGGLDNKYGDLIVHVDDIIGSSTSLEGIEYTKDGKTVTKYRVIQLLGQGTFGQVVKCIDLNTNKQVAIKILKNKPAYFKQSLIEVTVLQFLNEYYDNTSHSRILHMYDYFMYYNHICIVNELLGLDLFELMRRNRNHGFSIQTIRKFIQQILRALEILSQANVVHCDIKPENILLVGQTSKVKLIDFGSSCFENYTLYSYIQSRHYRAPEIVLGLPYSCAIDMWSVGCMTAEFFLGYPLFGVSCEYNLISRMVEMLGMPPAFMLRKGTKVHEFFNYENDQFVLKEQIEYEYENNVKLPQNKNYFKYKTLSELISFNQMRVSNSELVAADKVRDSLYDFLKHCLVHDPRYRMTPDQALQHPFITDEPLEDFVMPERIYPFVEYGKTVTLDQEDFIDVMLKEMPELQYIQGNYNAQQYFKIFKTALDNGHVVNIMADSPLRGTITPPSLYQVFHPVFSSRHAHDKERKEKVPREFEAKVISNEENENDSYEDEYENRNQSKKSHSHCVIEKQVPLSKSTSKKINTIDKPKGVSLPSSLESSPRRSAKEEKEMRKREEKALKELKKKEAKEEKERRKEEKRLSRSASKDIKDKSRSRSRETSVDRKDTKVSEKELKRRSGSITPRNFLNKFSKASISNGDLVSTLNEDERSMSVDKGQDKIMKQNTNHLSLNSQNASNGINSNQSKSINITINSNSLNHSNNDINNNNNNTFHSLSTSNNSSGRSSRESPSYLEDSSTAKKKRSDSFDMAKKKKKGFSFFHKKDKKSDEESEKTEESSSKELNMRNSKDISDKKGRRSRNVSEERSDSKERKDHKDHHKEGKEKDDKK